MVWDKINITKEQYDELKLKDNAQLRLWLEENLSRSILYGYGLYQVGKVFDVSGEYGVSFLRGETCD
jgi:hypothetical protein